MATDRRVRAGVNMDGSFFAPVPTSGLGERPFLMLGTKAQHSPGSADATWQRDRQRLNGWKRWLTVAGSGHFTFVDLPILGGQRGRVPAGPAHLAGNLLLALRCSYHSEVGAGAIGARPRTASAAAPRSRCSPPASTMVRADW
jgi:hypothetical protein